MITIEQENNLYNLAKEMARAQTEYAFAKTMHPEYSKSASALAQKARNEFDSYLNSLIDPEEKAAAYGPVYNVV